MALFHLDIYLDILMSSTYMLPDSLVSSNLCGNISHLSWNIDVVESLWKVTKYIQFIVIWIVGFYLPSHHLALMNLKYLEMVYDLWHCNPLTCYIKFSELCCINGYLSSTFENELVHIMIKAVMRLSEISKPT